MKKTLKILDYLPTMRVLKCLEGDGSHRYIDCVNLPIDGKINEKPWLLVGQTITVDLMIPMVYLAMGVSIVTSAEDIEVAE